MKIPKIGVIKSTNNTKISFRNLTAETVITILQQLDPQSRLSLEMTWSGPKIIISPAIIPDEDEKFRSLMS